MDDRSRQYCEDCLPAYWDAQAASFTSAGRMKLQELRASGIDPSQSSAAAEKRRRAMRQWRKEELEWDAAHPGTEVDEEVFREDILPGLKRLSLTQISEATGLSPQYYSLVRRGLNVPILDIG